LLGYVYGKGKVTDLPIIVVDEDRSEMSSKAMQMFDDNEVLDITSLLYDQNNPSKIVRSRMRGDYPRGLRKWFLPSDIRKIIVNTSNVLTANYAYCFASLPWDVKSRIEMETLRKQGTPEKLLATQYEPFKTTFINITGALTTCIFWPGVLAAVLQQVLLLGLALAFASEFENGSFKKLVQNAPRY
jgi:ABC-2 type transport system permease protein